MRLFLLLSMKEPRHTRVKGMSSLTKAFSKMSKLGLTTAVSYGGQVQACSLEDLDMNGY